LGNRSYRVVALALVLAALFLAPFVANSVHAQTIASGGQGVVFTQVVGVGGSVAFFFNLTSYQYTGPTTYIYLSPNNNPFLTMGDTIVSEPFSTVNVRYVAGNVTLTTQYVENFINNLYGNESFSGATNAAAVYNSLVKYGWALVYLKLSTGLPSPTYTTPAIAAGPFNLTLRPAVSLVQSGSYFSYYNCSTTFNSYGILTYRSLPWLNITFAPFAGHYISASSNYSIVVTGATLSPATVPVLVYNHTVINKSGTLHYYNSSYVFTVEDNTESAAYYSPTTYTLGIKSATINPAFILPYLSQVYDTPLYGFNVSLISVNVYTGHNHTIVYVPPPPTGYTAVLNSGTLVGKVTTAVSIPNLTISVSNANLTIIPSTQTVKVVNVNGWFDVLPSFTYTSTATSVAGPTFQLNPDDIVNLTFANMPAHTVFTSTSAVGNELILPSEPPAKYEWNYGYAAMLEGFFTWNSELDQIGNLTNLTGFVAGNVVYNAATGTAVTSNSVAFLIPNAPFGLPYSYVGFYPEFTYTAELATGNATETAAVYGDFAGNNCVLQVYPFVQLETSNENGVFSFNTTANTKAPGTAFFGNYLLVRGFGFASNSYAGLTISTAFTNAYLSPMWNTLQTDQYGDFVYITRIPYSGSWVNAVISTYSTVRGGVWVTVNVSTTLYWGDVYANVTVASGLAFNITIPYGAGDAIVYVNPTPTTYLSTTPSLLGGNLYTVSLGGQIAMPTTLYKFPYEATQFITNESASVIPASMGEIGHVVITGGGLVNYPGVTLVFYVPEEFKAPSGTTGYAAQGYFNVYPVSPTNGFADLFNVPVPDLAGNATYALSLMNVTAAQYNKVPVGEPSYTGVYIMTVDEVLANNFALAITVFNETTPTATPNPLGLSTLAYTYPVGTGYAYVYLWPALSTVPWFLVMPGVQLTAYVFGSPVSPYFSGQTTTPIPFTVLYKSYCTSHLTTYTAGYIVNGTLWSESTPYYPGSFYKGAVLNPLSCSTGLYTLIIQNLTGTNTAVPATSPAMEGTLIVYPRELPIYVVTTLPSEVVTVSLVGSGSTANAGEPYMVLVNLTVAGMPYSQVQYFFTQPQVSVQAYVLSSANQAMQLPSSYITQGPMIGGYQVYYITLPSNVTYGQLVVIVTGTTTYYFTGTTYSGEAAAEMGIVPPVNTTAISKVVSQAVEEIEANVTGEIGQVESNMANYYDLLSLQLAAVQQRLANYIVGNASALQTALSSLGVQLSGQITTAQQTLAGYMAGNFSAVLKYLSSVNSTLSTLSSVVSQLSTITSNLEGVASQLSSINTYMAGNFSEIESSLSSISSYMASNFSSISSGISTLEGDLVAVGGEVGSIGANVLDLMKSVNTLTSYETAALNYLTSMNSTLGSLSSTLSSVSSTLSSVSSTVSSMSSTLSGVSSSLGTISSDLSTVGSDLSSISGTLSSMSGTLSSVSSTVSSISSQLSTMSSTLSSTSSTASNAYTEATHAAQLAASAATYSLAALIVAIIALALIAYVAFAKM